MPPIPTYDEHLDAIAKEYGDKGYRVIMPENASPPLVLIGPSPDRETIVVIPITHTNVVKSRIAASTRYAWADRVLIQIVGPSAQKTIRSYECVGCNHKWGSTGSVACPNCGRHGTVIRLDKAART